MAQSKQDMGSGNVRSLMLQLMIPAVIAQVVNLLYNIVDRIYIGHIAGIGAAALTGVGLFTPILMLLNAFAMLVGAGGAPRTAIALGQGDKKQAEKIISNSFTMLLLFSVVLTIGFYAGAPMLLRLFGASDATLPYALSYSRIYIAGSVFVLVVLGMNPFITTQGFAKTSMLTTVIGAVINIILDPILIFGLGLGVRGAAIATVASQVVSAVLTVRCIHGSQGMPWHLQLKNIRIERSVLLAICRIGLPGAAQSALYSISNMTIQSAINGFGTVAVAAWSVYGKIDFLFWMTVSSFGIAVTTFAGQNFGARQYDRVRRGTMTCLAMTAGTTLCISLALYPLAQLLFRLFSSDDAVVAQGVQMMHYLVPVYMTYICIEIFSGALRGCGDVRVPTIITVFAVCIMRIVWLAVALPFKHELSVVEFSYPLTWITATVLFAIYYTKGGWMQRCIAVQNAKTQG